MKLLRTILLIGVGVLGPLAAASAKDDHPILWPENQRAFWTGGGALLLDEDRREQLVDASEPERQALLDDWLADPDPSTTPNETLAAITARIELARSLYPSPSDDRYKLLFLHGPPRSREVVDCGRTFRPIELWHYGPEETEKDEFALVLFQPELDPAYKLWIPTMGKGPLYTREMHYWLQQYHELREFIVGRRFDLELCKEARLVERATGVGGLVEYRKKRPSIQELSQWLQPPEGIATWTRSVKRLPDAQQAGLQLGEVLLAFPKELDQMMLASLLVKVPAAAVKAFVVPDTETQEYRLSVSGEVERFDDDQVYGSFFEDFRLRFNSAAGVSDADLSLIVNRRYRPGQRLLMRLLIKDEVSQRSAIVVRGFTVPDEISEFDLPVSEEALAAIEDREAAEKVQGRDSILLIPPETDLVIGLWRAEAIVTGANIERVAFLVDGQRQFRRTRPPFTAELRLGKYPEEQIVRVEGLDAQGTVVASDEIMLNQQRGALRVRVTEPPRGTTPAGPTTASAQVTVPEERRLVSVAFSVNNEEQAVLSKPPWRTQIEVPQVLSEQDISYLTVVATLDDGTVSEEVRFLNVPAYLDVVDIDLVELYTTVTEGTRLALDLKQSDFSVFEDGRRQEMAKFELVNDRPLTVGITIDTSGSMIESLGEAQRAAVGFLENVVSPSDQTFAVAFSDKPQLLMPRTSDVGAVAETLEQIGAAGNTALNDAIVTSLYYFRGVRGRKVLVLLSDGEDTASSLDFKSALEYARRSGVVVYTIGLGIGRTMISVRNSLNNLSRETGGRSFYIHQASELRTAYAQIERELRSQYLLAYQSDRPATNDATFREVEVKVTGKRKARTISGYYP